MPAALRTALNFLVGLLAIITGRLVWQAFGLIGVAVLLVAVCTFGYFTNKPKPKAAAEPNKPNPWETHT